MREDKIIILSINGIGDALMLTPMVRLLGEKRPASSITVLTTLQGVKAIFETCPHVDHVVLIGRSLRSMGQGWRQLAALRQRRFHLSITGFSSCHYENMIAGYIHARNRIVLAPPDGRKRGLSYIFQNLQIPMTLNDNAVRQNVHLLSPLKIAPEKLDDFEPHIWLTRDDIADGRRFLSDREISPDDLIVGFHPGSSGEKGMIHKRWPKEKFAALGDRLLQAYPQTRILIFGGPEEEDLKKEINDRMAGECAIVSHLSLRATAALIKQCRVFVSNDSGLLHVAAAVKTPSVGLFGPTSPITNGPYGGGHAVLTRDLDCRPCCPVLKLRRRGRFTPTCDERICLTRLRVTRVFEAVEPIIRNRSGQTSDIDGLSIQEKPKGRD